MSQEKGSTGLLPGNPGQTKIPEQRARIVSLLVCCSGEYICVGPVGQAEESMECKLVGTEHVKHLLAKTVVITFVSAVVLGHLLSHLPFIVIENNID